MSGHNHGDVFASSGGVFDWHELTTTSELASASAARSCGIVAMTAVGYASGQALVGTSCRRPGTVGIYTKDQGKWHWAGPVLPASIDSGNVDVLGLQATSRGVWALLGISTPHGTSLVAAWTGDLHLQWQISRVLSVPSSEQALSFGADGPMGLFVLTFSSAVPKKLFVLAGPRAAWEALPTPPRGTATVAFGSAGRVDALAVDDTSFTDWRLVPRSGRWARVQAITVAIQFGSSS